MQELCVKTLVSEAQMTKGKSILSEIVAMLVDLIKHGEKQ